MATITTNPVPAFPGILMDEVETNSHGRCILLLIPIDTPDDELEETTSGKSMVLGHTLKKDGEPGVSFLNNKVKDKQGRSVALNVYATRQKEAYVPRQGNKPKNYNPYG